MFAITAALALMQGIIWKFSLLSLFTMFAFEVLTPFFLYKTYESRFFELLEKVVFGLTLTALIIWALHELFHPLRSALIGLINVLHPFSSEAMNTGGVKRSLLFYTFMYEDTLMDFGVYRNSGFAHEPGGFAVFANLGLFYSLMRGIRLNSFRNLVYILAIMSTFSTAGILSMFIILFIAVYQIRRVDLIIMFCMLAIPGCVYLYNNTSFLGAKIQEQFEEQTDRTLNESTTGRLYGARKSINVLTNHPITGRGLLSISRPTSPNDPEFAAYGWLSDVSRYGILFGAIGLFLFISGFRKWVKSYTSSKLILTLGIISLFISLSSQSYLTNPLFFTFVFIGIYYKPQLNARSEKALP